MLKFCFLASSLLLLCVYGTKGKENLECEDLQPWCEIGDEYCTQPAMRKFCQRTCDFCLPKECDECEFDCARQEDGSYKCACYDGYEMDSNGNCIDIDECAQGHICKEGEFCKNGQGYYHCVADRCKLHYSEGYRRSWSYPERCCKKTHGQCGQNSINTDIWASRIIGGNGQSWPWKAFIRGSGHICFGALIHNQWITSGAHCLLEKALKRHNFKRLEVFLGVTDSGKFKTPFVQRRFVKQLIVHEEYKFPSNDIALLKMNKAAVLQDYISPVCLPQGEVVQKGTKCFMASSGAISDPVDAPIHRPDVCNVKYGDMVDVDTEKMICAGISLNETICAVRLESDKYQSPLDLPSRNGEPLVCQSCNNCDWFLAGIGSISDECSSKNSFSIFTNIEHYEEWIKSKIPELELKKSKCVTARWGMWSEWEECTRDCGGGTQKRWRACLNGEAGKPGCWGSDSETRACNTHACTPY